MADHLDAHETDQDDDLSDFLDRLDLPPRVAAQVHLHAAAEENGTIDQLVTLMHADPEQYESMVDELVPHVEAGRAEGDESEGDDFDDEQDNYDQDDETEGD